MKEDAKDKTIIIRRPKRGGGGHHGGAWKVALADFMTSMTLFFIVMWIINMLTPAKKEGVASYFKEFTILKSYPKGSFVESYPEGSFIEMKPGRPEEEKVEESKKLEEKLKKGLEEGLPQNLVSQLMVDTFEKGIKIQLVETEGHPMFHLGSSELTPEAKEIIKMIAENIKRVGNKIVVEGHTDSRQYKSSEYTNWELSTGRASRTRRELELNGIDPKRFAQVTGYADTRLLIKNNPSDPRNRRVSVLLFLK